MAKYCAKCWTFVPEGDVCPRCNNNVLTDVNKKPEKVKPKKKQTSLTEGSKKKKSPLVWVALGICVALAMVLVAVLLSGIWKNDTSENNVVTSEQETMVNWDEVPYAEGLEYTLLDDGTYAVTWWGDWNGSALNIPPTYEGKPVTKIERGAFSVADGEVIIEIKIPDSVITIEDGAFVDCDQAKNIEIGAGVKNIEGGAFSHCSRLLEFKVDSKNNNYVCIDGVLYTKDETELVVCPGGKSGKYEIPDGVLKIECEAFSGCKALSEIEISNSVTMIGESAFYDCEGLTNITIPESVTEIQDYAFKWCSNLKEITIPNSVTSIGYAAFEFCDNLTDIYYIGTETEWNAIEKDDIGTSATVHFSE